MNSYRVIVKAGQSYRRSEYECFVGAMTIDSACVKTRKWARVSNLFRPTITLIEEVNANIVG